MSAPPEGSRARLPWLGEKPWLKVACVALLLVLMAAEAAARFIAGFGNPPIVLLDEKIEYYVKPSGNFRRFGNSIQTNPYGMRGDDFPQLKSHPNELRLLVLGDSVVYGGHRLNQDQIATHQLRGMLEAQLDRPTTVANISASSWGPPNMEAYLSRFGTFDADAAILVLSSHDITDVPLFVAGTEPYWTSKPWCALHDALKSTYERISNARSARRKEAADPADVGASRRVVLDSTQRIFDRLEKDGVKAFVALHQERKELGQGPASGHEAFRALANQRGIPVIELGPPFQASIERGAMPYEDFIHPNAAGMTIMAQEFSTMIVDWLGVARSP